MTHFLWMHPWDLEGWDPDAFLDHIQAAGIDEVRLALAYHGGRMLLPRNRRHLVYEQHESAVYFSVTGSWYGAIQPVEGPHIDIAARFLERAFARRFPVRAWLVLCHNDLLGRKHPEVCIRNLRGEPYSYALCPAQPEVQEYILALIRDASRLPVSGLDLEALSFLGYEHHSLHDKRAVAIDPRWNSCHCSVCRGEDRRVEVIAALLDRIRAVTDHPIDLRYTENENFYGGKTHLSAALLAGRVDSITRTFFGRPATEIAPFACPVPANVGFVFHPPDTRSPEDLMARYAASAGSAGVGFYCYGLASEEHWSWLPTRR